jgi:hypothetical protein
MANRFRERGLAGQWVCVCCGARGVCLNMARRCGRRPYARRPGSTGLRARLAEFVRLSVLCGALLAVMVAPIARAASGPTVVATAAQLPGNAEPNSLPQMNSISCPSPGDCAATGYYNFHGSNGAALSERGMLLTETSGVWAAGVEAVQPANGSSSPNVFLPAVSCSSAGNCLAVGGYGIGGSEFRGMLVDEASGNVGAGCRGAAARERGGFARRPPRVGFVRGCW